MSWSCYVIWWSQDVLVVWSFLISSPMDGRNCSINPIFVIRCFSGVGFCFICCNKWFNMLSDYHFTSLTVHCLFVLEYESYGVLMVLQGYQQHVILVVCCIDTSCRNGLWSLYLWLFFRSSGA